MFCLVLTNLGTVYSIGDNTYGELGQSEEIKNSFELIEIQKFQGINVIDIDAGARHGLILTNQHKLYSFGDNSEGQCALEELRAYCPTEIPIKSVILRAKPEKIFCGEAHSVMVTNDGEVFS